ncbi:MAG: TolC family protein [Azoarcus sp.]|nr:TolC family protein [Azoarcus sp.]
MNRTRIKLGCLFIVGLLALPARAGGTLASALDAAWQRAAVARVAIGELRAAEAVSDSAGRWWAESPSIALSHRDDRWHTDFGKRETGVDLSLPLWLPGQRNAHGQAAAAGLARADASQRAARWRLAGEVRESAWRLAALQAEAVQMATAASSLTQLAADVRRRVDAGELPRTDLLAAQAEELAARNRLASADLQLREAALQWRTLTGLDHHPQTAALAETVPADVTIGDDHPALQEAAGEAESAARQLDLARTSRGAPPELTIGWRRDIGGHGASGEESVVLGVRLPFGTDDRNKPLLARAEAAADVARTREQRQREQVAASIANARDALGVADAQAASASEQARLLRERSTLLERAFGAGELALPELLRALEAASAADANAARQQALLGLARAQLLQSLGQHP